MSDETLGIRAMWNFNDPEGSESTFRDALDDERLDDGQRLALRTQIARTFSLRSMFHAAHAELDEIEAAMDEDTPPVVRVRYHLERGRTLRSAGETEASIDEFVEAWNLARDERIDGLAVDAAHMLGIAKAGTEAIEWHEKAIAYAERTGTPEAMRWLGALYNNLGWTYHDEGQYERALELFESGWAWRKERDDTEATLIAEWTVGRALRSMERHDEALERQQSVLRQRTALDQPGGFVHEELGELYLLRDDIEKAREHFGRAHELLKDFDWVEQDRLARIERLATDG